MNKIEIIRKAQFRNECYNFDTGILKIYFSAPKDLVVSEYPNATCSTVELVCEDKPGKNIKLLNVWFYPVVFGESLYKQKIHLGLTAEEANILLKKRI